MANISNIEVELLEYCIVEETVKLPVSRIKVSIPKLTVNTSSGKTYPKSTILINDNACKPKISGNVILSNGLVLKVFSDIYSSKSIDKVQVSEDPVTYEYYIRKGSRMIACFMDKNINDGYLTNFI